MIKLFIGIDNGVTGTIAILGETYSDFMLTPSKKEQDYCKKAQNISRIVFKDFKKILMNAMEKNGCDKTETMILMERPVVNPSPKMFRTSICSSRAFENQLCAIEDLGIGYMICDSKDWQRIYLPKGTSGEQLKVKSKELGGRMFPQYSTLINKHKDADALFIALYLQRKIKGEI